MKILLIEDDQETHSTIEKFLKMKGHSITSAYDGAGGLALLQKEEFDKIILDMSMPKMSGSDFLKELKKKRMLQNSKIIIYSSLQFTREEKDFLKEMGADQVVSKESGLNELNRILES